MAKGIFLDIESNGLDPYHHQVMQIALQLVELETGQCLTQFQSNVFLTREEWLQSDRISLEFNGLNDYEVLKKAPTRQEVGAKITELLMAYDVNRDSSIFICQNPSFDRPFFAQLVDTYSQEKYGWPYHWLDLASMFWSRHVARQGLPHLRSLSKDAIAKALQLEPEAKPHKAMGGVDHLIRCYGALVGWPTVKVQQAIQSSAAANQVSREASIHQTKE